MLECLGCALDARSRFRILNPARTSPRDPPFGKSTDKESRQMVTMSSFGKFHGGSNAELFREITTIHASLLHSRIAVRIPLGQSKSIHSRLIRRRRIARSTVPGCTQFLIDEISTSRVLVVYWSTEEGRSDSTYYVLRH